MPLRTRSGEVRPAWMLSLFLVLVVAAFGLTGVMVGLFSAELSQSALPWVWTSTVGALMVVATWVCLRLQGRRLADLGLIVSRSRLAEISAGFVLGVALFSAVALTQSLLIGTTWQLNPHAAASAVGAGLAMMLLSVLFEELLFRGYAFDRLNAMGGSTVALVVTSAAFGAYHLIGQPYWAMGAFFQFAMPALGGLIFGYARLRSRGMMLPIGLHWGANWAILSLFGWHIADANAGDTRTVWVASATRTQADALIAPDLLPHLPYLAAIATMALLVWRYPRLIRRPVS